ncbi:MAG TPA: pinensin family lanthipeptide [Longimicrobium sp.]|nr:pinensin family lanthipeptide [Longimicrobium sp.]
MKKLILELDELQVESFMTDAEMEERGTINGESLPTRPLCSKYCPPSMYCVQTETCTVEVCC